MSSAGRADEFVNGSVHFVPAPTDPNVRWSPPRSFAFVTRLSWIPLADTELLNVSQFLPLAIQLQGWQPRVVALLSDDYLATRPVNAAGRWLPRYVPMALRALPFWLTDEARADGPDLLIATDLGLLGPEHERPLRAAREIAPEARTVQRTLGMIRDGQSRLAAAAERLMMIEALSLIIPREGQASSRDTVYGVNSGKLGAASTLSLCASVRHDLLAFEVAAAILFSTRHLQKDVITNTRTSPGAVAELETEGDLTSLIRGTHQLPVHLDDSESIDISDLLGRE